MPIQTLPELQAKIRGTLMRPELRRGSIGIKIVSLGSGKVVFEENAEKYFMPASNMKNFTVAAAMEKLSPDFRFVTSVFASAKPDAAGTIKGGITVYGRGDISISTAFNPPTPVVPDSGSPPKTDPAVYLRGLEALADKITQAGVKRIEGDLVGDESYFSGGEIPGSWEWDDLQWYYGAGISALPLNDNAVDLSIKPGAPNTQCFVQITPINPVYKIVNNCTTTASGSRDIRVDKRLGQNIVEVSGSVPANDPGYSSAITVTHPADIFMALLRQVLEKRGIVVTGQTRVIGAKEKAVLAVASSTAPVEIARLESAPFSLVAAKTMKPSQNMYTETILWTLGEQVGDKTNPKLTSAEKGAAVVRSFLKDIGVPEGSVVIHDGSGLSRHNLITPNSVATLYSYMAKSRYAAAWRDSLTIGGIDGTLRNRYKGTAAAGNMRGKTGTIDQVSALSGYLTTAGGEELVISIIINGVPEGSALRQSIADEIVVNLANFNGKID
jgi:D-alanyl-D-alanine carboxypeptidase/D-alanyl-D-alanine-endopeptidase (penicillin-binding protein 4)